MDKRIISIFSGIKIFSGEIFKKPYISINILSLENFEETESKFIFIELIENPNGNILKTLHKYFFLN